MTGAVDNTGEGLSEMDRAHRDFAYGLLDVVRTLSVALVRAGIVTAVELQHDFAALSEAIRTDGGSEIRMQPAQALAATMAQLVPTTPPAMPQDVGPFGAVVKAHIVGLFDICNALSDLLVRKNVASPAMLSAVLKEWGAHARQVEGEDVARLPEMLANAVGSLEAPAPPPNGNSARVVPLSRRPRVAIAAERGTSAEGDGGGDAA
jgi:hypothetical protein